MATYKKLRKEIEDLSMLYYTESGLPIEDKMDLQQYVDKIFLLIKKAGLRQIRKNKL